MTSERFVDRRDAGRRLGAAVVARLGEAPDPGAVVLGLPRGGVVVAAEVARALAAPLDVLVVRKLGVPGHSELAFGAVASGVRVLVEDVVASARLTPTEIEQVTARELAVAQAREHDYRGVRAAVPLAHRVAVVVDDGVATGATVRAAVTALQRRTDDAPTRVLLAVPVAPPETLRRLAAEVDDVVCLAAPSWFGAVGQFYDDFGQVSDTEVRRLLGMRTT